MISCDSYFLNTFFRAEEPQDMISSTISEQNGLYPNSSGWTQIHYNWECLHEGYYFLVRLHSNILCMTNMTSLHSLLISRCHRSNTQEKPGETGRSDIRERINEWIWSDTVTNGKAWNYNNLYVRMYVFIRIDFLKIYLYFSIFVYVCGHVYLPVFHFS